MEPDEFNRRAGPRQTIPMFEPYGSDEPPCPWCGEELDRYVSVDTVVTCPACGREAFLILGEGLEIVGLRSPADVKYEEWRKERAAGAEVKAR